MQKGYIDITVWNEYKLFYMGDNMEKILYDLYMEWVTLNDYPHVSASDLISNIYDMEPSEKRFNDIKWLSAFIVMWEQWENNI